MYKRLAAPHQSRIPLSKKPAVSLKCEDDVCWSCVAGGRGKNSGKAQNAKSFRGCCWSCYSHRTCDKCKTFFENLDAAWCGKCHDHPALWCPSCTEKADLDQLICRHCFAAARKARFRRSDGMCWDCCCSKRRADEAKYKCCCLECAARRTCWCGKFQHGALQMCSRCQAHDALWCTWCHGEDLVHKVLCKWCVTLSAEVAEKVDLPSHQIGDKLCQDCGSRRREYHKSKYLGCCMECWRRRQCEICKHVSHTRVTACTLCGGNALWCTQCFSQETVARHLCTACVNCYMCCGKFASSVQATSRCQEHGCDEMPLWCNACESQSILALQRCRKHSILRVCQCGATCDRPFLERCSKCNNGHAVWCKVCYGKDACAASMCQSCCRIRTCLCGQFAGGGDADWCDFCRNRSAWICTDCREAGFRRFACQSCTRSGRKSPEVYPFKPRSERDRQVFEIERMEEEDPYGLRVRNVLVEIVAADREMLVMVPHTGRGVHPCSFGQLKQILRDIYKVNINSQTRLIGPQSRSGEPTISNDDEPIPWLGVTHLVQLRR